MNQHDLYRHYDVTAKNCPAPFVARPSDWTRFKNEVARKLKGDTTSDKFYTYTPDRVVTLREIGLYEDVTLKKTIKRYPEGTRLTITGIEYDGKTPRLKTAKGYITANKKNVKGYHTSIGTIKVLVDDLNYYDTARWTNPDGQVNKDEVFTVVKKVGDMYLLKSGFYITASSKFVEKYLDIIQQNKGKKFKPEDGIEEIDESDGHNNFIVFVLMLLNPIYEYDLDD